MVPLTIHELLDLEPSDEDWLVKDLILKDSYNLITGPTGVGKTQLLFHLAYHLTTGKNWFEWSIPEKQNVLFIEKEMSQRELLRMVHVMKENLLFGEEHGKLDFLPVGEVISVLTRDGQEFYEEHAEKYDVIIVDTLSSATHTNLKDEDGVRTMIDFILKLSHSGVTVVAAHHDVKAASVGSAEDVYGNRWIIDKASAIVRLSRVPREDDMIILSTPKVRSASDKMKLELSRSGSLWLSSNQFSLEKPVVRSVKEALRDPDNLF